jgi:OmcA/MtrC family decaheme c-type cytochrome
MQTSKISRCLSQFRSGIALGVFAALACAGPTGPQGPAGNGADAGTAPDVIDYGVLTPAELEIAKVAAQLTNVSIPADGQPELTLKVTERHGSGLRGMTADVVTWRFALIKLTQGVNGSGNDSWVSYMAANDHSVASTETATTTNLTDNKDGTYKYKFAKNVTAGPSAAGTVYEPAKVHRLVVMLYAAGTPFSPVNVVKDFIPNSGADVTNQNEKVDGAACLECHTQFRAIAGETGQLGAGEFHGGVRYDVRTCSACHNDQKRFAAATSGIDSPAIGSDATWSKNLTVVNNEAWVNFPVFIHKIHMGDKLKMTGGTYTGLDKPYEITYPQDVRNCVKCHRAPAPLADNWEAQPSRRACNACHDDISFVSPPPNGRKLHTGGPVNNDGLCLLCHSAGAPAGPIATSHIPVSPPNPANIYSNPTSTGNSNTNAANVAAAGSVPPGAHAVTYDVKSVSTWNDAGTTRPQIVFKLKLDGADVVFPAPTGSNELIPGFVGSPSAYFAFAVPQDGIAKPADFNATGSAYIRNVWNGAGTCSNVPASSTTSPTGGATLTGPDSTGYYTLQAKCIVVPANATMLTGGIGYTYGLGALNASNSALNFANNTQPLTQINLAAYPYTPNANGYGGVGGLIVPAPDLWKVATGYTGRRQIVANEKCNGCHVSLGVGPDFHAGQRNDATSCNFCHNPNQTNGGWSGNQKDFIHSIHGAGKRAVPFTWHEESPTEGFFNVTYPAVLNRCEMCHLPGTYDFSLPATAAALPNMLFSSVGQGTYTAGPTITPYVTTGNNYGSAFSFSALTGTSTDAALTTLVKSPIVAACSACHDSPVAIDHMQTNGGSFYLDRSAAFSKPQGEECMICHGPNRIAAVSLVHTDKTP